MSRAFQSINPEIKPTEIEPEPEPPSDVRAISVLEVATNLFMAFDPRMAEALQWCLEFYRQGKSAVAADVLFEEFTPEVTDAADAAGE